MTDSNKKKILYLDCASGISGDMFAAAMLDLGADKAVLQHALDSIPAGGFRTEISRVKKQAVDCCDFRVVLDAALENHDDDMEYLFGEDYDADSSHHGHGHHHSHAHDDHSHTHAEHEHVHDGHSHHHAEHDHDHGNHDHSAHTHTHHGDHVHRNLQDVRDILATVEMTEPARTLADKIFVILAKAEAKAHGATVDNVHFHEVGAVDSIVDIVTAAVCFDNLGVDGVYVSPLFEGSGTIRCAHGLLPIPVPAVANIMADSTLQMTIHPEVHGEFITPTGAAIAAAVSTEKKLPDVFAVKGVGLGAGKRDYARSNYLRAMLLEVPDSMKESQNAPDDAGTEHIYKLETDIDDCTGEVLGYLLERLMEAGARDAHYLPVYMKKNRPAWQLQVICTEDKIRAMEELIFTESTSIGIRRIRMERTALQREICEIETPCGPARVKICRFHGTEKYYPEYESAAALARDTGRPLAEIFHMIRETAQKRKGW
ncbi:MAG: nickel pincer cofactor biosynthesis protein LarC [Eubacterium sp.]|nr:nickel pincer cofactor biosynthesis protein LarC [Eubacterium sp.]